MTETKILEPLGWDENFARAGEPYRARGLLPGRVARQDKHAYTVLTAAGVVQATAAGRLLASAGPGGDGLPVVGDWVVVDPPVAGRASLRAVLPRRTHFARGPAEPLPGGGARRTEARILAANVDTVFVVSTFDRDLKPSRLERYLALVREGGARAAIVLNKVDLCPRGGRDAVLDALGPLADGGGGDGDGARLHVVSAAEGTGLDALTAYTGAGQTVALVGSSGVGKSSLVNRLVDGAHLATGAVRAADSRGRHTTTWRELIPLRGGGVLIDTPGLREVQMLDDAASLAGAFPEIEALTPSCRFPDCNHFQDPGCALQDALDAGRLDPRRCESYLKLSAEIARAQQRRTAANRRQKAGASTNGKKTIGRRRGYDRRQERRGWQEGLP